MARSIFLLTLCLILTVSYAFVPSKTLTSRARPLRFSAEKDDDTTAADVETKKPTLEEKMSSWDATEEEIKAATLGGIVPGRNDAFDVGLYIAFPLMVASGLFFAFFPLIMGNLDTSEFGPPPTV